MSLWRSQLNPANRALKEDITNGSQSPQDLAQVDERIRALVKEYAETNGRQIEFSDLNSDAQRQLVRATTAFNGISDSGSYNSEKREITILKRDGTSFRITGLPSIVGLATEGALEALVNTIRELPEGGQPGQITERTSTGYRWVNAGEVGTGTGNVLPGDNLLSETVAQGTTGLVRTTANLAIQTEQFYSIVFGDGTVDFLASW